MANTQLVEVAADGHLALPEATVNKLHLGPGMKLKVLADDDAVLVMKLLNGTMEESTAREGELRLQQAALAKIWDDPAEDIYNEDV